LFLCTNKGQLENKINKLFSLAIMSKKNLKINLIGKVKDSEKYKALLKEMKHQINRKASHVHGLEDLY
jgi:hypothetical protein